MTDLVLLEGVDFISEHLFLRKPQTSAVFWYAHMLRTSRRPVPAVALSQNVGNK